MPGQTAQTAWGSGLVGSAAINASSSGNNVVVAAADADARIVVLGYSLVCAQAVVASWESESGLVIGGPCSFGANGGISVEEAEHGHFATEPGEDLVLDLSGAVQVGGHLVYAVCR